MIVVKVKGGLGNQLFQYAAALQLSQIYNNKVLLDLSFFNDEKFKVHFKLDRFSIQYDESSVLNKAVKPSFFSSRIRKILFYKTNFFPHPDSNVINGDALPYPIKKLSSLNKNEWFLLDGWLQRIDYFESIRTLLSEKIWLKHEFAINDSQSELIRNSNSVAVHVRRGDMAVNPNFNNLGQDYYEKAIDEVSRFCINPHFFVFSDEPEKVKDLFSNVKSPVTFITAQSESLGYYGTKGDYIDFELMRLCKHFIIANSTFSWWPAYLAQTKGEIVVAPAVWYKNNLLQSNFLKSGLLQKEWKIIEN
jgi:hypothetical protein